MDRSLLDRKGQRRDEAPLKARGHLPNEDAMVRLVRTTQIRAMGEPFSPPNTRLKSVDPLSGPLPSPIGGRRTLTKPDRA